MNPLSAIILGIVQGLTEFLPISSSGHLVLAQNLLGHKEPALLFDVAVHLGTLVAVVVFYRNDLLRLFKSLPSLKKPDFKNNTDHNLLAALFVITLITGVVGLTGKDFFESLFASVSFVCSMLIVTGVVLLLTRAVPGSDTKKTVSLPKALVIGVAQSLAILPGISRSGSTIAAALFLKTGREEAARLSFLAMIPAALGAAILTAKDVASTESATLVASAIGIVVSAVVGYFALVILIRFVQSGKLYLFGPYCIGVGILGLLLL